MRSCLSAFGVRYCGWLLVVFPFGCSLLSCLLCGFCCFALFWVFVFDMLCALVFAAILRWVNSVVALVGNALLHVACGSLITLAIGLRFIMV